MLMPGPSILQSLQIVQGFIYYPVFIFPKEDYENLSINDYVCTRLVRYYPTVINDYYKSNITIKFNVTMTLF